MFNQRESESCGPESGPCLPVGAWCEKGIYEASPCPEHGLCCQAVWFTAYLAISWPCDLGKLLTLTKPSFLHSYKGDDISM